LLNIDDIIGDNMIQVLRNANDIRKCCLDDHQPSVLRRKYYYEPRIQSNGTKTIPNGINQVFIVEMSNRYVITKDATVYVQWRANRGLTITITGDLGYSNTYRSETYHTLFFHFLQLKYCCSNELEHGIHNLIHDYEINYQKNIFYLKCFQMILKYKKIFEFQICDEK
jgi:hypothetical protein